MFHDCFKVSFCLIGKCCKLDGVNYPPITLPLVWISGAFLWSTFSSDSGTPEPTQGTI